MPPVFPTEMPCQPWTTEEKLCCPDDPGGDTPCGDPEVIEYKWTDAELIDIASRLLFYKTCQLFPGICSVTFRPCACECRDLSCCCTQSFVPLAGRYPVLEVTEVRLNGGAVLDSAYRLDEFSRLVRTDGDVWPRRQNLAADPATDDRTFLISYDVGRQVPLDLQYAAALLACELKRACGGQGCRLPDRIKTVVREGVTYEVEDLESLMMGSLQVPELDMILKNYDSCKDRPMMRERFWHPLLDESNDGVVS